MREPALEPIRVDVQSVSKTYGAKAVLHDVSFSLEPGTVTALLGRNGAGKSTAIRRVTGLGAGGGTVTFAGIPLLAHPKPYRVLGVDLGTPQAHPGRKVEDHLRLLARHLPDGERRIEEVVGLLGMEKLLDKRPRKFSTGMKRSVALAGAMLADPSVLILDEPINGLEVMAVHRVKAMLHQHAERGGTVLIASHILAEVERLADRILVLDDGRIAADEPLTSYLSRHASAETEIEVDDPAAFLAAATARGWRVREERPGLVVVAGQESRAIAMLARDGGVLVLRLAPRTVSLEEAFLGPGHQKPGPAPRETTQELEIAR